MATHLTRRDLGILLLVVGLAGALLVGRAWRAKAAQKGQAPAEPFRIAGNFYYVGSNDATAFLLTGPAGDVLLGGGYPTTAPMFLASIATLGFNVRDVKVLLNSDGGFGAAGALAPLQQATGAEVWASEGNAPIIEAGGADPGMAAPLRMLVRSGIAGYPPARVARRFRDGDTVRLGPIALTAHIPTRSGRGGVSWSFAVRDGERTLNVVSACDLGVTLGMRYPDQRADLERTIAALRALPVDIWVTGHARAWERYRKFLARNATKHPADAFIDPDGYYAYLDAAEADLRAGRTH